MPTNSAASGKPGRSNTVLRRVALYGAVAGAFPFCALVAMFGVGSSLENLVVMLVFIVLCWFVGCVVVHRVIRSLVPEPEPASSLEKLTESRREIVAAFEIERRRIERDLHDGAQQYLVTASMDVGEARLVLDSGDNEARLHEVRRLLDKAQDDAEAALRALRRTVSGIHPKVLSDLGLEAAVRGLCADAPVDVDLRVPHHLPVIPEGVIAAGYFLVSEALTNVAKYAPHARVSVLLVADADLHISIVDDGPGGAVVSPDHGLAGMRERLAAFGGSFTVVSPLGGPTSLSAQIPLLLRRGEFGVVR